MYVCAQMDMCVCVSELFHITRGKIFSCACGTCAKIEHALYHKNNLPVFKEQTSQRTCLHIHESNENAEGRDTVKSPSALSSNNTLPKNQREILKANTRPKADLKACIAVKITIETRKSLKSIV